MTIATLNSVKQKIKFHTFGKLGVKMSGYNTKIITYKNQTQIKHYGRSIKTDYSLSDEQKKDRKRKADTERTPQQIAKSIESSRNRTINSIYQYALANDWELFITLTFNPVKVDSKNYDSVVNALSNWFKKTKELYAPDLKYIIVPELHKNGGYHFHGLISDFGNLPLTIGKTTKSGDVIFNLISYNLGFSTATFVKSSDKCCSYILKYITKDLCAVTKNKKRYWCSKNLKKPKIETYEYMADEFENSMKDLIDFIEYRKVVNIEKAHNQMKIYGLNI